MTADDLEQCETKADIRANDGQRAIVIGTYRQVDVRQRRTGDPVYQGYAAVELADGTNVFLEPTWSSDAKRSDTERERFEGEQVFVIGKVHLEPPEPSEPVAYAVEPCVSPVEQIRVAKS